MKNLLTYINPTKMFNEECQTLVKLQIDNSLELGWNREDILLVTNFDYEYNGVKSLVIGDENYCSFFPPATKIYAIVELCNRGVLNDNLYWYHDFDTYQLNPIKLIRLKPELGDGDIGLSKYGQMPRLCSASMFFRPAAKDIFIVLKEYIEKVKCTDEVGLMRIVNDNIVNAKNRVRLINMTYALHYFNLSTNVKLLHWPVKAIHAHPTQDKIDIFLHGKNKMNLIIFPERLIKLFNKYGYG